MKPELIVFCVAIVLAIIGAIAIGRQIERDKLPKKPAPAVRLPDGWSPDCQGKQDYDCEFMSLSCRYYPGNYRTDGKSSAVANIYFGDRVLHRTEFYGDTEAEVKSRVEAWARNAIAQISFAINSAGLKL